MSETGTEPPPPDEVVIDRILARFGREPKASRGRAPEVDAALGECSKQFQLWDIERRSMDVGPVKREPIEREKPRDALGSTAKVAMAEATHALRRLVPASVLARKAFMGLRALKKVALRQPYRPAGSPEE